MSKVLVVEDEADMRNLIAHLLKRAGYEVTALANPVEALALLAGSPGEISAIVLDVMMPEMDGYSFSTRLRSEEGTRDIPLVVLTAKPNMKAVFAHLPNVVAVIEKPFPTQAVVESVRKALAGSPG